MRRSVSSMLRRAKTTTVHWGSAVHNLGTGTTTITRDTVRIAFMPGERHPVKIGEHTSTLAVVRERVTKGAPPQIAPSLSRCWPTRWCSGRYVTTRGPNWQFDFAALDGANENFTTAAARRRY